MLLYVDSLITYKDYIYAFCFKDSVSLIPSCMSARLVLENIRKGLNISDLVYNARDWYWYGHDLETLPKYSLENDFYKIDNTGLIYGFTEKGLSCVRDGLTDLILPNKIRGIQVDRIGTSCFSGAKLDFMFLPEGLREIERNAFYHTNLQFLSLPDSVIKIGDCAFEECYSLENVEFSTNIEEIGGCAFLNCLNLKHVYIPNSIKRIGDNCFTGISDIVVTVDKGKDELNVEKEEKPVFDLLDFSVIDDLFGEEIIEDGFHNNPLDSVDGIVNYLK